MTLAYTVKPDKLVQLKLFVETDGFNTFKFTNSNNLSMKQIIWIDSK